MTKILIMVHSLDLGGAQVFCANLCNELSKNKDFEIHLAISFNIIDKKFDYLFFNKRIIFHILNKKRGFSLKYLFKVRRLIKRIKPDIINTHTSFTLRYLLLIPFIKKINLIHTITNNPHQYNKKLYFLYKRRMHQKAWHKMVFVAISNKIADSLSEVYSYPRNKIFVIYNGINPLIVPSHLAKKYDLLNCGSLTDIKNQELLILAINELSNPKVRACIVGDGPNMNRYKNLIESKLLEKQISLVGKSSDPAHYYFESKIFVLTSKTEGNPITILEAFDAGLPVVAPNVGGIPDLVDNNVNGFLFEPTINSYQLAELLNKVLCLDKKSLQKISENNKEKVKQWYMTNIAKQYVDLIKEILTK